MKGRLGAFGAKPNRALVHTVFDFWEWWAGRHPSCQFWQHLCRERQSCHSKLSTLSVAPPVMHRQAILQGVMSGRRLHQRIMHLGAHMQSSDCNTRLCRSCFLVQVQGTPVTSLCARYNRVPSDPRVSLLIPELVPPAHFTVHGLGLEGCSLKR